jgi:hypothetical protein
MDRLNPAFRGAALAAPCTLNRLELSNNKSTRCHKLAHDPAAIQDCLLTMGVRCLPKHAREIVLDLDAMGHLVHGTQEGRHFSGYYDSYCYLPLYVFCGDVPLWAQLRTADQDGAAGTVPALEKIVAALRRRSPQARIIVRGDSGFCREEILAWCESQRVREGRTGAGDRGERAPGAGVIEPGVAGAGELGAVRAGAGLAVSLRWLTTTCRPRSFVKLNLQEECRWICWRSCQFALRERIRALWSLPPQNLGRPLPKIRPAKPKNLNADSGYEISGLNAGRERCGKMARISLQSDKPFSRWGS